MIFLLFRHEHKGYNTNQRRKKKALRDIKAITTVILLWKHESLTATWLLRSRPLQKK